MFIINSALNPDGTLPVERQVTNTPGLNLLGQWGEAQGFPELPDQAFEHAIEHLPTFLNGEHDVGGGWLIA